LGIAAGYLRFAPVLPAAILLGGIELAGYRGYFEVGILSSEANGLGLRRAIAALCGCKTVPRQFTNPVRGSAHGFEKYGVRRIW
jgi:hypothetical protein